MAKIQPATRKSLSQILKKKNILRNKQKPAPAVTEVKPQQTIAAPKIQQETSDSFFRETARDMVKKMPRYELKIIDANDIHSTTPIASMSSENSIWAPWSKMFKSK